MKIKLLLGSLLGLFTLAISVSSCKKYYEDVPVEQVTGEYLWDPLDSNGILANGYLSKIYSYLPQNLNRLSGGVDILCSVSDDAIPSTPSSDARTMATGGMTIFFGEGMDNVWAINYQGIRRATIFLNNFHIVPLKFPEERQSWYGEARILRAMFYWELVKRWGGIPLLGDSILSLEDNIELPRNSFEECIDYIVSECDRARDSLRNDPIDDANIGRFTKAGAMALKAQVLLYAASPRHNGGNPGDDLNGYANYDANRWKLAADASREIMNLNIFKLDTSFKDLFLRNRSFETIFARTKEQNRDIETRNAPPNISTAFAYGYTSPTQELVDAFAMDNGKDITDPTSGYNPDSPYVRREPRFYATILYNGALWINTPLQTYEGGINKPGGIIIQTRTSYYMRKFMGNFETATQFTNHYADRILFRFAETLLDFAEAQNEFSGPDAEVYVAVDSIRARAKLPPIEPGLSKEAMREVLIKERRREMAFEERRYWDIRRWKIAGQVYNQPLHGMNIIRTPAGDLTYLTVTVLNPVFDESKMYFYPIPFNEMVSNKNMVQNPGWE